MPPSGLLRRAPTSSPSVRWRSAATRSKTSPRGPASCARPARRSPRWPSSCSTRGSAISSWSSGIRTARSSRDSSAPAMRRPPSRRTGPACFSTATCGRTYCEAPPAQLLGLRRVPHLHSRRRAAGPAHQGRGCRAHHLRGPLARRRPGRPRARGRRRAAARHQRLAVRARQRRGAAAARHPPRGRDRHHRRLRQHRRRPGRPGLRRRQRRRRRHGRDPGAGRRSGSSTCWCSTSTWRPPPRLRCRRTSFASSSPTPLTEQNADRAGHRCSRRRPRAALERARSRAARLRREERFPVGRARASRAASTPASCAAHRRRCGRRRSCLRHRDAEPVQLGRFRRRRRATSPERIGFHYSVEPIADLVAADRRAAEAHRRRGRERAGAHPRNDLDGRVEHARPPGADERQQDRDLGRLLDHLRRLRRRLRADQGCAEDAGLGARPLAQRDRRDARRDSARSR